MVSLLSDGSAMVVADVRSGIGAPAEGREVERRRARDDDDESEDGNHWDLVS